METFKEILSDDTDNKISKDHVLDFLNNVHGATNFVQKATLQVCKSNVLGLISILVTAPL